MTTKKTMGGERDAAPFVKWVGGKRRLAERILALAPKKFDRYVEPFVGGGAVFFALRNAGFTGPAILSDANDELIDAYRVVRDSPERLMRNLDAFEDNYEALFYAVRAMDIAALSRPARAARFIFLNKAGFNGLWRVNKAGKCNTPWGRRENVRLYDADNILAVSRALHNTTILHQPFTSLAVDVGDGDFVYCDPPYVPVSETAYFTGYTKDGFGRMAQETLAEAARMWARRGATVVLSNADTKLVRELYAGMKVKRVRMARAINSKGSKRGKVNEVLAVAAVSKRGRRAA